MTWIEDLMKEHTGEKGVLDVDAFKKALGETYTENAVEKADYEKQIETLQTELSETKLTGAVERALLGAKARNVKAARALLDMNKVELLEDGTLKGMEDQLTALKESEDSGFLFEAAQSEGAQKGNGGTSKYKPKAGETHKESYGAQMAAEQKAAAEDAPAQSLWGEL